MKLFLCGGGSNTQIMYALNKFKSVVKKDKPILYSFINGEYFLHNFANFKRDINK